MVILHSSNKYYLLTYLLTYDSMVKAVDYRPTNPGSGPAVPQVRHFWQQEGHLARNAPVH